MTITINISSFGSIILRSWVSAVYYSDVDTSTTHFPVPFGTIFQIFWLKFLLTFFSIRNFLTVRAPPYGEKLKKIFPIVVLKLSVLGH